MTKAEDILNESTNSIHLNGGIQARKGSIAATLKNIQMFDQYLKKEKTEILPEIEQAIEDQKELLPVIHSLDLMKLFSIEEWLQKDDALGRIFFTLLYLQTYPENMSKSIISRLKAISSWTHPILSLNCKKLLSLSTTST